MGTKGLEILTRGSGDSKGTVNQGEMNYVEMLHAKGQCSARAWHKVHVKCGKWTKKK